MVFGFPDVFAEVVQGQGTEFIVGEQLVGPFYQGGLRYGGFVVVGAVEKQVLSAYKIAVARFEQGQQAVAVQSGRERGGVFLGSEGGNGRKKVIPDRSGRMVHTRRDTWSGDDQGYPDTAFFAGCFAPAERGIVAAGAIVGDIEDVGIGI